MLISVAPSLRLSAEDGGNLFTYLGEIQAEGLISNRKTEDWK